MSRSHQFVWALLAPILMSGAALAQDPQQKSIDERFREMQEKYEKRISALELEVRELRDESAEHHEHGSEIDRAIAHLPHPPAASARCFELHQHQVNPVDVSLDILMIAGTSTEREASIQLLEGGGHDPKKRGFTLSSAELALTGQVAPCFTGDLRIVYLISPDGESEVELEEAYVSSTCLPRGMHVEAGQFFTEFGRINVKHPHEWDFLDQPVMNTRLFGPDGMRAPGARLGWLTGLPWFCDIHVSAQNANGETMTSFYSEEEAFNEFPIGGRPFVEQDVRNLGDLVYLLRVDNGFMLNACTTVRLGASTLFGPNATGRDGSTWITGTDLIVRWRPQGRRSGWPFVTWQSEAAYRKYRADNFFDPGDPADPTDDVAIAGETLGDWGLYSQLLYGFQPNWIAGIRYEHATGSGADVDAATGMPVSRSEDPFRDDRHRFSALLTFMPTEFSRFRLQYNYDLAQHLETGDAHSIWMGIEFLFGKHAAHKY